MNNKKLESTLSGNQEFMKLIESDDTSTTEMLDRLFIAEEAMVLILSNGYLPKTVSHIIRGATAQQCVCRRWRILQKLWKE